VQEPPPFEGLKEVADRKVVLVTGATRGIGRALAKELSSRGHRVYGAGRKWEDDPGFETVEMDVRSDESVAAAVGRIVAEAGRLDVLVNNAGISHSGSVEDTPLQVAANVFETNYFGLTRLIRSVLPHMRGRGRGTIVNVGSAAGKIGVPFQPHYAASKFAVEGLSESLWHELSAFGIRVLLVEPGDVGTQIWEKSKHVTPEGSPYKNAMSRYHRIKAKEMGKSADSPARVAKKIADLVESDTRRLRHPVAKGAAFILFLRKVLPDRIFLWAVARNYGTRAKE